MQNDVPAGPMQTSAMVEPQPQDLERQFAIKQIEQRRRLTANVVVSSAGMLVLVAIWAISEYNNAGGWPTGGFSQSSGIPGVWKMWILYPLLAWLFFLAVNIGYVLVRRPISEDEIRREMTRHRGS